MQKYEFTPGTDLGDAFVCLVQKMIESHDIFWAEFNGAPIFSNDSIDDVYKRVTGKTYLEVQGEIDMLSDKSLKNKMISDSTNENRDSEFLNTSREFIQPEKWDEWKLFVKENDLNEKSFDSGLLIRLTSLVNAKHEYEIPDILPIGKSNDYYLKIASDSRKFLKSGNAVSKYILNNIIKK